MPNIQIKDVPADTHAILRRRAADVGQSLQEYLLGKLIADAAQPPLDEALDRAAAHAGGSFGLTDAYAALSDERTRR